MGLTAWQALFNTAALNKGQRVLIHGAAGAVGSFAVQLAEWKGAHVIGTASGRDQAFLRELGVDEPIDYEKTHFEDVVHGCGRGCVLSQFQAPLKSTTLKGRQKVDLLDFATMLDLYRLWFEAVFRTFHSPEPHAGEPRPAPTTCHLATPASQTQTGPTR